MTTTFVASASGGQVAKHKSNSNTVSELSASANAANGVTEDDLFDPSPDIHGLFVQFNQMYFYHTLGGVELNWSKRMTLCAGVCQYYGSRSGRCSIRLSEPLLQYRPRSDLIDTLLHEMIHAYLFVTRNNTDRDGHGPMFQEHMHRINRLAGTSITVYHTFRDEVDVHRKHIWRCNGICRTRAPFFGYVRRANNRAPGPYDYWFAQHKASCNGVFLKEAEPEGYKSKKRSSTVVRGGTLKQDMKKKAKIFTINGPVLNGAADVTEPGVKSDSVVPFSCNGFVLRSGEHLTVATPHPVLKLQSHSGSKPGKTKSPVKKRADSSSVSKQSSNSSTNRSPLKQSSLTDHFSQRASSGIRDNKSPLSGDRKESGNRSPKVADTFPKTSDSVVVLDTDSDENDADLVCALELSLCEANSGPSSQQNSSSSFMHTDMVDCPSCGASIESAIINTHLDLCLL